MEIFRFIAQISLDGNPGESGFQAQRFYILLNILVPVVMGALLVGPVKWIEKLVTPSRGGRS